MRATIDIPDKVFKKTKIKGVATKELEREVGRTRVSSPEEAALDEAMAPQLRFLAMNREQRAKAFLAESKAMARFYAAHPEEVLPDFYDDPAHESKAR